MSQLIIKYLLHANFKIYCFIINCGYKPFHYDEVCDIIHNPTFWTQYKE